MRVLIFHGYLLHGSGSNVYNNELASALVELGHEVHLICQERHPFDFEWVDAAGDWDGGELAVVDRRERVRGTVYRPDIRGLLPVFVADSYEGIQAKVFPELTEAELERYIECNVEAVREIVRRVQPEAALANHLVMGPVILARALRGEVPYAVKAHGSDIEYALQPYPKFRRYAEVGIESARAVLVGSSHIARRVHETVDLPNLKERVVLGPPGVNIEAFSPGEGNIEGLIERMNAAPAKGDSSTFARDTAHSARALTEIKPTDQLVIFVGKFIGSKGVDLLLAAWPLVLERVPQARLVIVGYGEFEEGLKQLQAHIEQGELEKASEMVTERELPLKWVREFFEQSGYLAPSARKRSEYGASASVEQGGYLAPSARKRSEYEASASQMAKRISWIGRLEHSELADLLPTGDAMVVPSVFPEAFGMVAIEGAACGLFPVVANHSGLAEVADTLGQELPQPARDWLTFNKGTHAIPQLADNLINWLTASDDLRQQVRHSLVQTTRETYSWHGVAKRVIAAGMGELADLPTLQTAQEDRIRRP